jgi:amidohydrolase
MTQFPLHKLVSRYRPDLRPYEDIRRRIHSHPELSEQEARTAALVVEHLGSLGAYEIHAGIGGHGVAAVLANGPGATVLLRADMDALPVEEQTGLPFASRVRMRDFDGIVKPVMHACGHDMHVAALLAAAHALANARPAWSGTVILVFQPDEERSGGAQRMVDGGLYDRVPIPDVVLGQHVAPFRAGELGTRIGPIMAASDSLRLTLFGRGGHASMPDRTVDPVVMAASTVMRLQTIVSREIEPGAEMAVVTVASIQAGQTANVIADRAELVVNVRTVEPRTRDKVLAAIRRIVKAECAASAAPREPSIELISTFPATVNDPAVTETIQAAFAAFFGPHFHPDLPRVNGSEDISALATAVGKPCSYWMVGATDPETWDDAVERGTVETDVPVNHSPLFAPVMQPTLRVGTDALMLAAMAFLRPPERSG